MYRSIDLELAIVFCCCLFGVCVCSADWDYLGSKGHADPAKWHEKYELCNGKRQSPIAISFHDLVRDDSLESLQFEGYRNPVINATIVNNGHSVQVTMPPSSRLLLRSNSLNAVYRLSQFHFHWSHRDDTGSEHVLDGKHYPLEVHFVHLLDSPTAQTGNKTNLDYSIVVVSVMYNLVQDNPDMDAHNELRTITDLLPSLADEDAQGAVDKPITVDNLLPDDRSGYMRYDGSLTTPPCSEDVEWILLTKTLNLTSTQIEKFRIIKHSVLVELKEQQSAIFAEAEVILDENVRPLQQLNQRQVRWRKSLGNMFAEARASGVSSVFGAINALCIVPLAVATLFARHY